MEKTVSITSARSQLLKLSKQVFRHMDRYVLTNKGVAETVLLSVSEYNSLRAAAELAAHPEVLATTLRGFEEIERGEGLSFEQTFASQEKDQEARAASTRE
jgi:PHD/YefM family antitoxin component YafN of YafNO toxin-antitoxin module